MKKIDGKKIAAKKLLALKDKVAQLNVEPAVAVIIIGDDAASHLYVKLKEKAAKEIGVELRKYAFAQNVSREDIQKTIEFLNKDVDTHGIIVQLPLPEHLSADEIIGMINPDKDVDGFHWMNRERFLSDAKNNIYPVFPQAIMMLVNDAREDIAGANVVILGKSDIFDSVMEHACKREGANTTFISCANKEKFSTNEQTLINSADIIITACGKPGILSCDVVAEHTIVIDGGISKVGDKTVGDLDTKECEDRKITISPVPGGVGPVTIACLLENVVTLTKKQN
jgi:methylenetetrahydrofolate dehydrogenase (NADP+)/methenyltetrahydrofolate cyclohydrolase